MIYDIRGTFYYPDGSIYLLELAQRVAEQNRIERETGEKAHIHQPNAKLPKNMTILNG